MVDNSTVPVAVGTEVFANKDISGVKYPKHIPTDGFGNEILPATHGDMTSLLAKDFATQTTLSAVLAKMIAAPATEATLSTANTNLASILTALQAQRAETIWTDDSGAYVIRVDKGGAITWVNPDGSAASAPGTGSRPAEMDAFAMTRSSYQATTGGTGYSTGDLIDHFVLVNPTTGAVIAHFWINLTTEAKLAAAPSSANIAVLSPEQQLMGARTDAANNATDGTSVSGMAVWKAISAAVQGALTLWGAKGDAKSNATDGTSVSIMQVVKQISASIQQLATVFGSTILDFGAGVAGSRTLRVALATDSAGIIGTAVPHRVLSAASTNVNNLKTTPGSLAEVDIYNTAAYDVYFKFFNKDSPVIGTDDPVWVIPLPAGGSYSKSFLRGKTFDTAISYAITKGAADHDTTVIAAGDVTGSIDVAS
jgi:hypothetical protein